MRHPGLQHIIRYAVVGIIGTATHIGSLVILVEQFALNPIIASTIGFIITLIISYYLNHYWTFHSGRTHTYALPRYTMVSLSGLVLNATIMHVTVNVFGWWYVIGQMCVILVVPASNFLMNYHWSFQHSDQT